MQVAGRASVFLASKLPKDPPPRTIQPQFETKIRTSADEQEKFLRYVRAADDPASVLDDMQSGRLTREGVETLREVYPKLYQQLQQEALERVTSAKKAMGYDQKLQLGMLLDVPADATLEPSFVARMQSMYTAQQAQPNASPAPKRPLKDFAESSELGRGRSG
jgi:hypothetical protein